MPGKYRQRSYDNLKTGELLENHLCHGHVNPKPLSLSNTMHSVHINQLKTIQQQTQGYKQNMYLTKHVEQSHFGTSNQFDRLPLLLKTPTRTRMSPLTPIPTHVKIKPPPMPVQYRLCIPQKKMK